MTQATHSTFLTATIYDSSAPEFCLPALNVISYRGPEDDTSVSTSLEPIVKQLNTKVSWLAVTKQPPSNVGLSRFTFHAPKITPILFEQHGKFSCQYLRPLFHGLHQQANFDPVSWKSFKQLNELVASQALNLSSQSFPTLFWVHDYELALVAPIISAHAGVIPCHFWHIPWPSPNLLTSSPISAELVGAMLTNQLIGFQTTEYATNFLTTVQELAPKAMVDVLRMTVKLGRTTSKLVVLPFGIDVQFWQTKAKNSRPLAQVLAKQYKCGSLVLGIDRLSTSKGIIEKLEGLAEFLKINPSWRKRFQYVQITHTDDRHDRLSNQYLEVLTDKISKINAFNSIDSWKPIIHLQSNLDKEELAAWYQAADVLAVNSFVEGLSLVAKEYIASRSDDQGVVMLSKGSGSVPELAQGIIQIDPASSQSFASGLLEALSMSKEEASRRMQLMKRVINQNNLQEWAVNFLSQALA